MLQEGSVSIGVFYDALLSEIDGDPVALEMPEEDCFSFVKGIRMAQSIAIFFDPLLTSVQSIHLNGELVEESHSDNRTFSLVSPKTPLRLGSGSDNLLYMKCRRTSPTCRHA